MLIRYWLATPEGRAADPAPLGDLSGAPTLPPALAYALQQAINGLPLAAVYALLAASYSLVYGLVGRINLAFGQIAAAGGYAAALGAVLTATQVARDDPRGGPDLRRRRRGILGRRFEPLGFPAAASRERPTGADRLDRPRAVPAANSFA